MSVQVHYMLHGPEPHILLFGWRLLLKRFIYTLLQATSSKEMMGWDERNLLRCLTVLSPWYLYSSNKLVATMLPRLQLSLIPAAEITQFIRHHSQPNCVCCRIFLWTGLVVIFQMFQENEEDSGTLRPCAHRLSYREWHPPANQKHYISHFCLADAQAMVPTCRGLSPPLPYNPSIHQSSAPFLCRSLIAYP